MVGAIAHFISIMGKHTWFCVTATRSYDRVPIVPCLHGLARTFACSVVARLVAEVFVLSCRAIVHCTCFFVPGLLVNKLDNWIPALCSARVLMCVLV
jgi:hypothetical protein